jgi:hypothetical protein
MTEPTPAPQSPTDHGDVPFVTIWDADGNVVHEAEDPNREDG